MLKLSNCGVRIVEQTFRSTNLIRFATFEVDLRTGELRKDGVKLKFSGQPFQVLAILLERPGDIVTREELQKRLWPDTFVDVERNLNTAVNKIREVLGDSAESPRFVETLPRRGYRFIGELERPVEPVVGPAVEPVMAITVEPARRSDFRKLWWKVAAGIAIIAVVVGVIYLRSKPQRPQEQAVLTAVPFTALPGAAISPAFSPDGSRIAFAWNGDSKGGAKGFDLYVKVIGSETLLRLTQHPSDWISAAWSPDGTQIVFHRLAGTDTGLYVVPALGGPERKLRSTLMRSGPELWPLPTRLSVGRWMASGSLSPTNCQKEAMSSGCISSPPKHWRPNRLQSVRSAMNKVCLRSPTTASISHTGAFNIRTTKPGCIPYPFLTESRR